MSATGNRDRASVRLQRRRHAYFTAFGELDGVGDEVAQDLRDLALVVVHDERGVALLEHEAHVFAHQQRAEHAAQRAEQVRDAEFHGAHFGLAGLDLREVQQVVDQLGEILGGLGDETDLLRLFLVEIAVGAIGEEPRQRADRVQRRAELVDSC